MYCTPSTKELAATVAPAVAVNKLPFVLGRIAVTAPVDVLFAVNTALGVSEVALVPPFSTATTPVTLTARPVNVVAVPVPVGVVEFFVNLTPTVLADAPINVKSVVPTVAII